MQIFRRLAHLLHPRRDRDLAEEMRFHQAQLEAEGATPTQAARAFGNDLLLRERARDQWGWLWLEQLGRDLRHTARLLRRSPGFALVAVLSLAVGIGANLAVFSLVDAVALRPIPGAAHPGQLIRLDWTSHLWDTPNNWGSNYSDASGTNVNTYFSYPLYQAWQRSHRTLAGLLAFRPLSHIDLSVGGHPEAAQGTLVTGSYNATLGLKPALGRSLTEDDMAPGAPAVAMLSYACWQARFGGSPTALGSVIQVNHLPMTVVGIQPKGFQGLEIGRSADVFLPMPLVQGSMMHGLPSPQLSDPTYWFVEVAARLKPGVTRAQARADLGIAFQQAAAALPRDPSFHDDKPRLLAFSAAHGVNNSGQDFTQPIQILFALTGLLMLIVCINLANLLLARAAARAAEIAVRVAIGAGRIVLIRQLLTESLGLALLGALASLPLAVLAARAMATFFLPAGFALHPRLEPDALGLAFGLALAAALLMGLVPALRATRRQPQPSLRRPGHRMGEALLIAQVALCLLVLSAAGLFLRTLRNLQTAPVGFDANNITLFHISAALEGYDGPGQTLFYQRALHALQRLPGVASASATNIVPGGNGGSSTHDISIIPDSRQNPRTLLASVAPDYFATYRIPLLAGREFGPGDTAAAPFVVIINRAMAARFAGFPLGQRLYWRRDSQTETVTVVGVVPDAAYNGVQVAGTPVVYSPLAQHPAATLNFIVRSPQPSTTLLPQVRAAVHSLDPQVPLYDVQTQAQAMAATYQNQSMLAALSSILGALALLLAAIGLYGLMAYNVTRRTREIGVRIALGATRANVLALVLRHSVALVALGTALGLPLAWFADRSFQTLLYGVRPSSPTTLLAAIAFLFTVAAAATWLPARRAANIDPMAALRCE